MLKVGITGGIGSGKSTASNRMADWGAYVFDADKEAKNILIENNRVYRKIIDQFSSDIINHDDTINQKKQCACILFKLHLLWRYVRKGNDFTPVNSWRYRSLLYR